MHDTVYKSRTEPASKIVSSEIYGNFRRKIYENLLITYNAYVNQLFPSPAL